MKMAQHWRPDGTCDCPFDGTCCECGKLCNDHDLVADWWWCGECINRHLDEDELKRGHPLGYFPDGIPTNFIDHVYPEKKEKV